jgi:lipid A 3-O-deacylase
MIAIDRSTTGMLVFRSCWQTLGQLVRAQVTGWRFLAAIFAAIVLSLPAKTRAADIVIGPPPVIPAAAAVMVPELYDPTRWEVRFGGFAHGVGSVEKGTWDINGEIVLPQFFGKNPLGWWSWLLPRLHAGVNYNLTGGRTSVVYAGFLWTIPFTEKLFAEVFFDGAAHNGSLTGGPSQVALGCEYQFHVGGSLGYRLNSNWSVMFTFDHLSNGSGIGLSNCPRNVGLNNYGARIGYTF